MRFSESQRTMPFDFAILNKNNEIAFLLEYDGEQHFQEVDIWEGRDNLAIRQMRDQEKEETCQRMNIPLERISYKRRNHLEEALLPLLATYNIPIISPS